MFYTMRQNNARGVTNYDANLGIDKFVIIEADDEGEAWDIVNTFPDGPVCYECCGARWGYFDNPTATPQTYDDDVVFNSDKPNTFVHYQNGDIVAARG